MNMRNLTGNLTSKAKELSATGSNRGNIANPAPIKPAVSAAPAAAAIAVTATPIDNPDLAYQATTTKNDISGLTFGDSYDSISDNRLTVDFSVPLIKAGPVPDGWATWSSPPFSESPNPDMLYSESNMVEMTLSRPVRVFGFELEPSPFDEIEFTADFFRGNQLVESITRTVNGNSGARLFARIGESIDRVIVTGGSDFAIAQVRYQLPINVLVIVLLILLLIVLLLLLLL